MVGFRRSGHIYAHHSYTAAIVQWKARMAIEASDSSKFALLISFPLNMKPTIDLSKFCLSKFHA